MSEEAKKIAEQIRSGKYYQEARHWYGAVYISPISERTYFLIVAILSAFVALFGVLAAFSLMPLTTKPAIAVPADPRAEDIVLSLIPLRKPGDDLDESFRRFFVTQYVQSREGYAAPSYQRDSNFIRAQSNDATYSEYAANYLPANPQSPAAILGVNGLRVVTINSVSISGRGETGSARVKFSTEMKGVDDTTKTQWTAKLEFHYTSLKSQTVTNPETKEKELKITDPTFQVTKYVLTQD